MRNQIMNYLRAGYPGIYLLSSEEARVEAEHPLARTPQARRGGRL